MVTPPSFRFDLAIEEDCRRGNRAPPRLRRDPRGAGGARAGHAARARAGADGERAQAPPGGARLAGGDHLQLRLGGDRIGARSRARRRRSRRSAVLNPIASHLDVMRTTLAGGPDRGAAHQPRAPRRARPRVRGRTLLSAHGTGLRPAAAHRRARLRRRARANSGARPAGRSTSSTSRPTSRRWSRRIRCAPRAARTRRCIRAAARASPSTAGRSAGSANCTRGWSRRSSCRARRCCSSSTSPR